MDCRVLLLSLFLHLEVESVPNMRLPRSLINKPLPLHNVIVPVIRKPKSPSVSHVIVPNLHVIPLTGLHQVHGNTQIVAHTITHSNSTGTVLPVLIPIHNLVPVHDLTVIPLHKEPKISFRLSSESREDQVSRYRHPLGGYGAGWYFGGHGAGHGFHYAYG